MTQPLTPPPPKGYFYAVVPVTQYDFALADPPIEHRLGFKLQLRKRRPFWFSDLVGTVFMPADSVTLCVSIKTIDAAAAELNRIIEIHDIYTNSAENIKNVVKETNQRA